MIYIKDFINRRQTCPICESDLEIQVTCPSVFNMTYSLSEDVLKIQSLYFDFNVNITNNDIKKFHGSIGNHWEFRLSLFCPTHIRDEVDFYEAKLFFDVYNGTIANENFIEQLRVDNYQLNSHSGLDYTELINITNRKYITFPYFDYSNMSLTKLKSKIKTYLIMQ